MTAMVASAIDWGESIVLRQVWGLSLAAWAFVISGFSGFVGLLWDGAWHASWGRDTFFIPPHDLMYGGITLSMGVAVGLLVTASRRPRDRSMVQIGLLQAPLGIWLMLIGMAVMLSSAAYDDWWHTNIGHIEGDVVLWSPPHFIGLCGAILAACGAILFVLREIRVPTRANGKPLWVWEKLDLPALGLLLIFSYLAFMLAGATLDRYLIYDKLRFDGSIYPLLALSLGPALLVVAQRVTNRAGAATFAVLLGFILAGLVAFIVKDLLGYPRAASLPIMGLVTTILLDLTFKRFGRGYKWLALLGPVFVLVFYATEFLWAWYLTRYPWWPLERTLMMIPIGIIIGTASLLLGALIASGMERAGWLRHVSIRERRRI
ncbi:MAG TPA: hypothetical protein VFD70_30320 [Anaerolineae bacterium]|nr:hypothetical protein [Anaerolineae bacterium]